MKMTRKLIPAFVMLIVSAIMLSTASFAWFATNREVTAKNMSVTANASIKFLHISTQANDGFDTEVDAANAEKTVDLIHAKIATDNKTVSWYLGDSAESDKVGTTDSTPLSSDKVSAEVDPADPADSLYALINTFYFKMSDTSNVNLTNLTVSEITVSGASNLKTALRVLVVGADGAQIWKVAEAGATTLVNAGGNNAQYLITSAITNASPATQSVKVYVYYDGEDASAYSDNAENLGAMTVNVTFTATEAVGS